MVPFAGYRDAAALPGRRSEGAPAHARGSGLFDVSHMGQIALRAASRPVEDAARALEALIPPTSLGLEPGRQRYGLLTNDARRHSRRPDGGQSRRPSLLVVNAACKDADVGTSRRPSAGRCTHRAAADRALAGAAGPASRSGAGRARARMSPRCASWMCARRDRRAAHCLVSRSGYTGEDGFEIARRRRDAAELWRTAAATTPTVSRSGSARATACGSRPGFASMATISTRHDPGRGGARLGDPKARRAGGARAGGFPGARPHPGRARDRGDAAARRPAARRQGAGAAGAPLYADEEAARRRRRHLGRLRADRRRRRSRWATCHVRSRAGYAGLRRGARQAPAGHCPASVRSADLQAQLRIHESIQETSTC